MTTFQQAVFERPGRAYNPPTTPGAHGKVAPVWALRAGRSPDAFFRGSCLHLNSQPPTGPLAVVSLADTSFIWDFHTQYPGHFGSYFPPQVGIVHPVNFRRFSALRSGDWLRGPSHRFITEELESILPRSFILGKLNAVGLKAAASSTRLLSQRPSWYRPSHGSQFWRGRYGFRR